MQTDSLEKLDTKKVQKGVKFPEILKNWTEKKWFLKKKKVITFFSLIMKQILKNWTKILKNWTKNLEKQEYFNLKNWNAKPKGPWPKMLVRTLVGKQVGFSA